LATYFILFALIDEFAFILRSALALPVGLPASLSEVRICDGYDLFRSAKENRVPAPANSPSRLPLLRAGSA
jgi:hypothetical protein